LLNTLYCQNNNLTSITGINTSPLLIWFIAANNQLSSIDFSNSPDLYWCMLGQNQFSNLDLSNSPSLGGLNCMDNQLTCLNVKSGNNDTISTFIATGNTSLTCIEVDDVSYSTSNWTNIDAGASFSTNCGNACSSVGIDENNQLSISIYPNPVKDILNINNETGKEITISLKDVAGKELVRKISTSQTASIDLNHYKAGIYFITVNNDNNVITQKIVKK
jgi:hypothetical protein